ncbi:H-NS family nucleoid-associated regulatory protein [Trinickia dinghuensis]|uniref:H-NS histone family protein n=1 Tax=Trinickia dinghuensis TaxID=2291023 RepID=A0A3D8JQ56_9BURK|nr:H-NS histone family protein [Trinickia dinghuensis]RDU95253.1 H-NS histone family protein [Trinickia dinghuensis]
MSTYKELLAKQRELDAQIAAARNEERAQAIATIRELMQQFEITSSDLAVKRGAYKRGSSQAKYRDPASGATWSGMGREPRWIAGKDRAAFAI